MKILINYADEKYKLTQEYCSKSAKKYFDRVIEYSPDDIDSVFYENNKKIFGIKRGNGLWLWKPYLILKTLEEVNDGDIVFYCDSGACFIKSPKHVFRILDKQDIWVSHLPLIEKQFTKKIVFEKMNLTDSQYTESNQISATFIAIKKSDDSIKFIREWLNYCCDYDIITPVEEGKENLEDNSFVSHREDQSVLSLLVKKYNIISFSDPSQFGKLPEKYARPNFIMKYVYKLDYPIFILHHRTSNANKKVIFKQWLCAVLPRWLSLKLIK